MDMTTGRTTMCKSAKLITIALMALLTLACGPQPGEPGDRARPASAEPELATSRDFGDYVLHFNAIRTDQLTPDVASQYNIVRSKNRALLNVSILRKQEGTPGVPVAGSVSAQAVNLTGQLKNLNIRQIQEGEAIYYIGDVSVSSGETLVFTIDATPMNETSRFSVRFVREFFAD